MVRNLLPGIKESDKDFHGVTWNTEDPNSLLGAPMLSWPFDYAFKHSRS